MQINVDKKITLDKNGVEVFFAEIVSDCDQKVLVTLEGIDDAVCYNCKGKSFLGEDFIKYVQLKKGVAKRFWFSVEKNGTGEIIVKSDKGEKLASQEIEVTYSDRICQDPYADINTLSRIKWLNSDLAINNEIPKPFTKVLYNERTVEILGRKIKLNALGLPASIESFFNQGLKLSEKPTEILQSDFTFCIDSECFENQKFDTALSEDKIIINAVSESENFILDIKAKYEFDGFCEYVISLTAKTDIEKDVCLNIPIKESISKYFVGLGQIGGKFNKSVDWKWNVEFNQDSFWTGDVNAGLKVKLKGENYVKPFVNIYYKHQKLNMPESWGNDGKGGIKYQDNIFKAYSGKKKFIKGQSVRFDFDLMITPMKEIDLKKQFNMRFYHKLFDSKIWFDMAKKGGANIINVHHGNDLNPYINYPFFETEELKKFIKKSHDNDIKVKVYYTIRELTIHLPEFRVFRDLEHEIFNKRNVYDIFYWQEDSDKWVKENVGEDVIPAWKQDLKGDKYKDSFDSAIITDGQSRICNFYIEGLRYLLNNVGADGIYVDDVAFDRNTMKRVRKILDQKEGRFIDFHTCNHHLDHMAKNNCVTLYTELFPYIDKVWIGEGFDYDNSTPEFWLVEMSGIPFGVMSEMMDTANQYRGLLFGMTNRYGWQTNKSDPINIWKIFDKYDLDKAELIGWWDERNSVKLSNDFIKASEYVVGDKKYVALANFSNEDQITNFSVLGAKGYLVPELDRFQDAIKIADKITIKGGCGLFVEVIS